MQRAEHLGYDVLDFDSFEEDMVDQWYLKKESAPDLELSLWGGRETGMCLIGSQSMRRIIGGECTPYTPPRHRGAS